jgi:hypothetical protein
MRGYLASAGMSLRRRQFLVAFIAVGAVLDKEAWYRRSARARPATSMRADIAPGQGVSP